MNLQLFDLVRIPSLEEIVSELGSIIDNFIVEYAGDAEAQDILLSLSASFGNNEFLPQMSAESLLSAFVAQIEEISKRRPDIAARLYVRIGHKFNLPSPTSGVDAGIFDAVRQAVEAAAAGRFAGSA